MTPDAAPILRHVRRIAAGGADAPSDGDCLEAFVRRRDETAFETLVRRHGPMVLRICRTLLGDAHAAEDAFQTTFLDLARQAATIRKRQSLTGWLYQVARRTALHIRKRSAEQSRCEPAATRPPVADPADEVSWREVQAVFFDEIGRLSGRYRDPVLLCCLEGLSRDEAAARLGVSTGTLKVRLERARKKLRDRLGRRGLELSAGLLAVLLNAGESNAVSPVLLAAAVNACRSATAKQATAGFLSGRVLSSSGKAAVLAMCTLAVAAAGHIVVDLATTPPATEAAGDDRTSAAGERSRTDALGDPLPPEAISRLGTLRMRHGDDTFFVRFLPGGNELVTYGSDGIRVWDGATGKQTRAIPEAAGETFPFARLHPAGKTLAVSTVRGVELWDLATGRLVRTVGRKPNHRLDFSPDGKLFALSSFDLSQPPIQVLDVNTDRPVWAWPAGSAQFTAVLFTPDARFVVVASAGRIPAAKDNHIRILDAATGEERRRIELGIVSASKLTASSDGRYLAAVCWDETALERHVRVWELAGGKEVFRTPARENGRSGLADYTAFAFSPEGTSLFVSGISEGLAEWDVVSGKELRRLGRGFASSTDLTFSPDGKSLAAAGARPAVRVIDRTSGSDRMPLPGHYQAITEAVFTTDGRGVVTADRQGRVTLWDAVTGVERNHLDLPPYSAITLSRDGRSVFYVDLADSGGSRQESLIVRDVASGGVRVIVPPEPVGKPYYRNVIVPGEKLVGLFHDAGQTIHLIDLRSGKPAGALHDPVLNATRAAFSDGDRTLVTLGRGRDARARIWDVARRTELRQIALKDDRPSDSPEQRRLAGLVATASAVSPDGRWIVCDSQKGYLRLLDTATGAEVRTLPGGRFGNSVFAFSPDGRTLARTGRDEAVHLIELATGKERHTFTGHRGRPVSLAFSRDGTALVSGSQDSTALVWDLTGRRIAARSLSPRELDASWADLLGDDAAKAYVAVRALAASAPGAVAYLESRLHPAAAADGKWVAALIADLDNDSFAAREKAESELDQLGEAAGPACTKALAAQPSAEARRRLEAILRKHTERERNPTGENLRALRALEVLEMIGSPPARRILESLARGLPGARITEEAKASRARLGAN